TCGPGTVDRSPAGVAGTPPGPATTAAVGVLAGLGGGAVASGRARAVPRTGRRGGAGARPRAGGRDGTVASGCAGARPRTGGRGGIGVAGCSCAVAGGRDRGVAVGGDP